MMFTLYSADFIGAPSNCSYPHKFEITDAAVLADAVKRDYVCAEYMNNYRSSDLINAQRNCSKLMPL